MKTRDDKQGLLFDDKKRRIRETTHEGAAHALEDNRKLPGIRDHALSQSIDRLSEAAP